MNIYNILSGKSKRYILTASGIVIPSTEIEIALPKQRFSKAMFRAWTTRPDMKNEITQDTGWFPNLIVDAGLDRLGSNAGFSAFHVGQGTTTPTVGDTALANYRAGIIATQGNITYVGGTPYVLRQTWTAQFAVGAANGNLTEMGMASAATTGNLWSRALILDGLGSPTTIVVQPTEALNVAYTLELSVPTSDVNGSCNITGSANHTTTTRPSNISSWASGSSLAGFRTAANAASSIVVYPGTLGAITSTPSGGGTVSATSHTAATYSTGSYLRSLTLTWNQTAGNISGGSPIQSIVLGLGGFPYQSQFSPTIAKDNTKTLVINYTAGWSR